MECLLEEYAFYDSRTLIDNYPSYVKRNIVTIKKMTLVIVQKAVDILKTVGVFF